MRAENVPERLRELANSTLGRPVGDVLIEAAEALEDQQLGQRGDDLAAREQHLDGQRRRANVMRYLDSARTQLEQSDDLKLPRPLDETPTDVRYAIERATLVGRAVDDLIDAVHVLNGSTGSEARELVAEQEARERQAGLFDRTDDSPAARRARGLEPIRPARSS